MRRRGFTLLELLVATAVLSILGLEARSLWTYRITRDAGQLTDSPCA